MLKINQKLTAVQLTDKIERLFDVSGAKIKSIEDSMDAHAPTPVYTEKGRYTARGWTEWTQGFRFGSALLQFDVTGDTAMLDIGLTGTLEHMAAHVSHTGVHDHGFNNVSTYGNLLRLIREGKVNNQGTDLVEAAKLALKVSGAIQASRWTELPENQGYICSFNGPHSLFADTIRSLRILNLSHRLGHVLMGEQDARISLLGRLLKHAEATAKYIVFWGEGRDAYDIRGRVVHEAIFNTRSGAFRCPSTQQGYSPFSTWTRGLAWVICGYAEQLESLSKLDDAEFAALPETYSGSKAKVLERFEAAARATSDFYIENTPTDGIPYWDTGAPGLAQMPDCLDRPSDPYNQYEPIDSSAAAITAQGLIRLGNYLAKNGAAADGKRYLQAGLTVADHIFAEPYLSTETNHQGLILHSIYHRPNGWDYIPEGQTIPCGESSMWGDYHARELALMIHRMARQEPYYAFDAMLGDA